MSQQASLSGATTKLPTWHPQGIPADEFELAAYRELAKQAVFSIWSQHHRATDLREINSFVGAQVKEKIRLREWPHSQFVRSKRFVDRRVNEAASQRYAVDGVPKIVAVTSGIYQPNPKLFAYSVFNGAPQPGYGCGCVWHVGMEAQTLTSVISVTAQPICAKCRWGIGKAFRCRNPKRKKRSGHYDDQLRWRKCKIFEVKELGGVTKKEAS